MINSSLRLSIFILFSVLFLFFLGPVLTSSILNLGNIFGMAASLYVMSRCLFRDKYKKLKRKCLKKTPTKIMWRTGQTVIALFTCYAVMISTAMIYFSAIKPAENATAITLGAKVHPDGAPSRAIYDRTKACYKYLKKHPRAKAVLSGGQGSDEGTSEAAYMYNALAESGISPSRLVTEDKSTNTDENIKNSYELIKKYSLNKNIAITTDSYHQLRARLIAKKQGITSQIGAVNAKTYPWIYPTYFVREWFALPYEYFKQTTR